MTLACEPTCSGTQFSYGAVAGRLSYGHGLFLDPTLSQDTRILRSTLDFDVAEDVDVYAFQLPTGITGDLAITMKWKRPGAPSPTMDMYAKISTCKTGTCTTFDTGGKIGYSGQNSGATWLQGTEEINVGADACLCIPAAKVANGKVFITLAGGDRQSYAEAPYQLTVSLDKTRLPICLTDTAPCNY
jgi:hypothetical protein